MNKVKDFIVNRDAHEVEIVGKSYRRNITTRDSIKTLREFADMPVLAFEKVPIEWEQTPTGKNITKWRYILYV